MAEEAREENAELHEQKKALELEVARLKGVIEGLRGC